MSRNDVLKGRDWREKNPFDIFFKNKAKLNRILKKQRELKLSTSYNDEILTNINTNCVYDNNLLSVYIARTVALFCLSRAVNSRESKQNNFLLNNILFCFSYQKKPLFVNQLTFVFNSVCITVYIVNKDLLYYFLSAVMHVFFYFSDSRIKCIISPINHKLFSSLSQCVYLCILVCVCVYFLNCIKTYFDTKHTLIVKKNSWCKHLEPRCASPTDANLTAIIPGYDALYISKTCCMTSQARGPALVSRDSLLSDPRLWRLLTSGGRGEGCSTCLRQVDVTRQHLLAREQLAL